MAKNIDAQFSKLRSRIDKEFERIEDVPRAFLTEFAKLVAERSKAIAPILKGELRENIQPNPGGPKKRGKKYHHAVVCNVPYAIKQHEQLTPAGPMKLGPVSSAQPSQPEGPVGGKFIERTVQYHGPKSLSRLAELAKKHKK